MAPTLVFLPEESHGQRSLAGYSLWGHKEWDMTEQLSLSTSLSFQELQLIIQENWFSVTGFLESFFVWANLKIPSSPEARHCWHSIAIVLTRIFFVCMKV